MNPNGGICLREVFEIERGTIAAFTGGGGKTSLILALCRELAEAGLRPIFTTTTRIYPPREMPVATWPADFGQFPVCVAAGPAPEGKLAGLEPEQIAALSRHADALLVEADGSKHMPLKCPAAHEPVIPPAATLVVPVAGASALGRPLAEVCHRPLLASALLGIDPIAPVSAETAARLVTACTRGAPRGARILPCINQADAYPAAARELAIALQAHGWPKVVLAAARNPECPVQGALSAKD